MQRDGTPVLAGGGAPWCRPHPGGQRGLILLPLQQAPSTNPSIPSLLGGPRGTRGCLWQPGAPHRDPRSHRGPGSRSPQPRLRCCAVARARRAPSSAMAPCTRMLRPLSSRLLALGLPGEAKAAAAGG